MSTVARDHPCCDQPGCNRTQPILLWHDGIDWFFVTEYVDAGPLGIRTAIIRHRVPSAAALVLDQAFEIGEREDDL